jgi:hypothetical protein
MLDGGLKEELARLSAAGTYKTWRQIDPPAWAPTALQRLSDDPAVVIKLARHDRRKIASGPNQASRIELNVPFARKEEAKAIGARWDPMKKVWWIAVDNDVALAKAVKGGLVNN